MKLTVRMKHISMSVSAEDAKAIEGADAQPEDVAITLNGTQDASKLGGHTDPGASSSSSSSSSSDGQAEPLYSGKLLTGI